MNLLCQGLSGFVCYSLSLMVSRTKGWDPQTYVTAVIWLNPPVLHYTQMKYYIYAHLLLLSGYREGMQRVTFEGKKSAIVFAVLTVLLMKVTEVHTL